MASFLLRYTQPAVAPVRERGLKSVSLLRLLASPLVAPVRERGLKFCAILPKRRLSSRSRKGTWIEIPSELQGRLQPRKSLP